MERDADGSSRDQYKEVITIKLSDEGEEQKGSTPSQCGESTTTDRRMPLCIPSREATTLPLDFFCVESVYLIEVTKKGVGVLEKDQVERNVAPMRLPAR